MFKEGYFKTDRQAKYIYRYKYMSIFQFFGKSYISNRKICEVISFQDLNSRINRFQTNHSYSFLSFVNINKLIFTNSSDFDSEKNDIKVEVKKDSSNIFLKN